MNSLHGQGILEPGKRVVVEGVAEDGTIEAIRIADAPGFALGVQWHAEYDPQRNPVNRALFQAFGAAVSERQTPRLRASGGQNRRWRRFDRRNGARYQQRARRETHVVQHLRPSVPVHQLRRKPRGGDRLRGRRLPAAHPADRGRHPGRSRQAPAGAVALHHPAPGAGRGEDHVRRVHRRGERQAGHHRHADHAADRERRPALEGLFRDQGQVPARPRRLHLRRQIRHHRLSRRRARLGARDRGAGRRRRRCAQNRAGHDGARRAHPDGPAQDRPFALGLERGRQQSVLLPGRQAGEVLRGAISTACARRARPAAR